MTTSNQHLIVLDRTAAQGRLELTDRDRFKLLHNMSTQDFNTLQPSEGRPAVLTTALARIIDRVIVYHRTGAEVALMLTHYPAVVRSWLQRHIFFNDKVRLRDASAEWGQIECYGAGAEAAAASLAPIAAALPIHHLVEFPVEGGTALIARTYPLLGAGFTVIAPMTALPALKAALLTHDGAVEGGPALYDRLRIEAGLAGAPGELTEDYLPLEAGSWDAVSFNKGCYIGQEIIARMESRQKLAKVLVKLRLPKLPSLGAAIRAGERTVGSVTSAAMTTEGAVALGYVKIDAADPGTRLSVTSTDEAELVAEVIAASLLQTGFAKA